MCVCGVVGPLPTVYSTTHMLLLDRLGGGGSGGLDHDRFVCQRTVLLHQRRGGRDRCGTARWAVVRGGGVAGRRQGTTVQKSAHPGVGNSTSTSPSAMASACVRRRARAGILQGWCARVKKLFLTHPSRP